MKKLLIFSIILILCFGGCSAAEAAGEYSFSLSDYYPDDGTVFCSYPEIFENKITNQKDLALKGYSFCGFTVKVKPNEKAKVLVQFYKDKGFFKNLLSEYWY